MTELYRDLSYLSPGAVQIDPRVAWEWRCESEEDPIPSHPHEIGCLWVWHNCAKILGPGTIAPGCEFGWRPSGVGAHTLVSVDPLTITASVYWPECCGLHGFITDGKWVQV